MIAILSARSPSQGNGRRKPRSARLGDGFGDVGGAEDGFFEPFVRVTRVSCGHADEYGDQHGGGDEIQVLERGPEDLLAVVGEEVPKSHWWPAFGASEGEKRIPRRCAPRNDDAFDFFRSL